MGNQILTYMDMPEGKHPAIKNKLLIHVTILMNLNIFVMSGTFQSQRVPFMEEETDLIPREESGISGHLWPRFFVMGG